MTRQFFPGDRIRVLSPILILGMILWLTSLQPVRAEESGPNDVIAANINTASALEALANDSNADHFGQVNQPLHGQTWSVGNGSITYLPAANYAGPDQFTYSAFDISGAEYTATVSVTVTGSPTAVAARNDTITIDEDVATALWPTANDAAGPGGGPLQVTVTSGPAHGQVTTQPDGSLLYTTSLDWSGEDTIAYDVSDGRSTATATVAITVNPVAEAPRLADDAIVLKQGDAAEIDVLANDMDPEGDAFDLISISQPALGTAVWNAATHMIDYQANADASGTDTVTYVVADETGQSSATLLITINGRPAATPDQVSVARDGSVMVDALANDTDPEGESLRVTRVEGGSTGTVDFDPDSGKLTYSPSPTSPTNDTFTYFVVDSVGNESSAVVTVTVADVANGAPIAKDDEYLVAANSDGYRLDVLANDVDPDGHPLSVEIDTTPDHGEVAVDANQNVTYVPDADYVGQDSFAYTITDDGGLKSSTVVSLEVQARNQPPVAAADAITIDEDGSASLNLLANDVDPDGDAISITMISTASLGTLTLDGSGNTTYVANPNASGTDVITYVVGDGLSGTSEGVLTVTINSINDVPVATDDEVTIQKDEGVVVPILANDIDADGDNLAIAIIQQPVLGAVAVLRDGTLAYQPTAGFHGDAIIGYSITDWTGASATALVTIHVGDPNHKPVAKTDRSAVKPNESVIIDAAVNDSDPDEDAFAIVSVETPKNGATAIVNGKIVYTPNPGYTGTDAFKYTIVDAGGFEDTATIKVKVDPDVTPTAPANP